MKMKKSVFIGSLLTCSLVFGAIGAGASTGIQKIQAALNYNITFKVDGKAWTPTDSSGKTLAPIVYNGTTYLPLRAAANALGATLEFNSGTQQVTLDSGASGIPYNDIAASPTPAPTTKPDAVVETAASAGKIIKLEGTTSAMTEKMQAQAAILLKAFAADLKAGKPTKVHAYMDAYMSDKRENSPISQGRSYFKDSYTAHLNDVLASNSAGTITSYVKSIETVKASQIETDYISGKSETSQSYKYRFQPEGWDSFSSIYVSFTFSADKNGSSTYILAGIDF